MLPANAEIITIRGNLTRVRIYRRNGETVDAHSTDAKMTVENHPDDWSFTPWPAENMDKSA